MKYTLPLRRCFLPVRLAAFGLLILLLFSSDPFPAAKAQSAREPALVAMRDHPVDFLHMAVNVRIRPRERLVSGEVTHVFTPLRQTVDSLRFNAVNMDIEHAYLNGKPVRFTNDGKIITVFPPLALHWDTIDSIRFVYRCHPTSGLYFVGWDDTTGRARKQVWSQGQGYGNRHWIPLYDEQNDKMTTETTITFDQGFQVLSNGTLVSRHDNPDGTCTWHYKMIHPMVSYLVMVGAGHYGIDTLRTKDNIPVHLWYYPDQKNRIRPTYHNTLDMFGFMKDETGIAYPWSSYSEIPVMDFIHGAMENTTATVYGDFYFVDSREALDRDFVNVNIHEFAHHWFGDFVTAPGEGWLHESFATYYAKLFEHKLYGEDHFEWMRHQEQMAAIRAEGQAHLSLLSPKAGADRIYDKGSAILGMLSYVYGKPAFNRVIHYYLTRHRYGFVHTYDLYTAFQHVLGVSPKWFFDEWIYRGGLPKYHVSWKDSTSGNGKKYTRIQVRQTAADSTGPLLFRMPVVCEVHYKNGKADRTRTWIAGKVQNVSIAQKSGSRVAFVLFDPGSHIIKEMDFPRTLAQLKAQAASAPHMIDRYEALAAIRSIPSGQKSDFLITRYHHEAFPEMRAEIVTQIAGDSSRAATSLILAALKDSSSVVRLAALSSLSRIRPELRPAVEKMLTDSSYSVIATALVRLAQTYPQKIPAYLKTTRGIDGPAHNVSILWNEINAGLGNRQSLDKLVDYTSPAFDFQTRTNAARVLQEMDYMNEALAGNLLQGITSSNYRLAGAFRQVLRHFAKNDHSKDLIQSAYSSHQWTPVEKSRLQSFFKSGYL